MYLLAKIDPVADSILDDIGFSFKVDNSASTTLLGVTYRPIKPGLIEMAHGILQKSEQAEVYKSDDYFVPV